MRLYHGTTQIAATSIIADGYIRGPVFLTARKDMAENYGAVVIACDVNVSDLNEDYDTENPIDDMTTEQWARSGRSVYVDDDVAIAE